MKLFAGSHGTANSAGEYKIWIDAVCINQNDELERASQVRKMRQIYSSAWAVIAWLGESDAGGWIPKAFAFSNMLASLQDDNQDLRTLCNPDSGILTDAGFLAMHEMTRHPYWMRLWIIQEVVMGASYTVLRCGDHHLSWDTFAGPPRYYITATTGASRTICFTERTAAE